jgi:hypothetical protein
MTCSADKTVCRGAKILPHKEKDLLFPEIVLSILLKKPRQYRRGLITNPCLYF